MTDRELMQQALEALEMWCKGPHDSATRRGANTRSSVAITALRERLAQPEPVAWVKPDGEIVVRTDYGGRLYYSEQNVYTAPPRREWVGLTDDEIAVICGECAASAHRTDDISYARAIEAKLKEKNTVRMRRATRDEKIDNPGVYWVEDKE